MKTDDAKTSSNPASVAIVLALALSLALASCGSDNGSDADGGDAARTRSWTEGTWYSLEESLMEYSVVGDVMSGGGHSGRRISETATEAFFDEGYWGFRLTKLDERYGRLQLVSEGQARYAFTVTKAPTGASVRGTYGDLSPSGAGRGRALGIAGIGGASLTIQSVLDADLSLTVDTLEDGSFITPPEIALGDAYFISTPGGLRLSFEPSIDGEDIGVVPSSEDFSFDVETLRTNYAYPPDTAGYVFVGFRGGIPAGSSCTVTGPDGLTAVRAVGMVSGVLPRTFDLAPFVRSTGAEGLYVEYGSGPLDPGAAGVERTLLFEVSAPGGVRAVRAVKVLVSREIRTITLDTANGGGGSFEVTVFSGGLAPKRLIRSPRDYRFFIPTDRGPISLAVVLLNDVVGYYALGVETSNIPALGTWTSLPDPPDELIKGNTDPTAPAILSQGDVIYAAFRHGGANFFLVH